MITMVKGDLIKAFKSGDIQILAHGCNCSGGFGSGVAGQIAQSWPNVRSEYLSLYKEGVCKLGSVQLIRVKPYGIIANCLTQQKYGSGAKKGTVYLSYVALASCMKYLEDSIPDNFKIGMPQIGCGLAGGDWKKVRELLCDVFEEKRVIIYYL